MDNAVEQIVSQVESFIDILELCHTKSLLDWNFKTLQRAILWAAYVREACTNPSW